MDFNIEDRAEFQILTFNLSGPLSPADLKNINLPNDINYQKGIIISGRGPIWLHATLAHILHPARWVATHDPRLGGGVVVQSHDPKIEVGDIVEI